MEEIHISEEAFAYQSLQNFLSKFPNEEACLKLFPAICKACGHNNRAVDPSARVIDCSKCKTKTWRTAGTYFQGLRRLMPTLAWIWLHEDRAVISINKFAALFDLAYATAWKIEARLQAVLEKEMDKHDVIELITSVFDPVIQKRSIDSTANEHPVYEDDDNQTQVQEQENLDEDQQAICAFLMPQPVEFDSLFQVSGLPIGKFSAALACLELQGIATRHAGNKYSLTKTNPTLLIGNQEQEILGRFFAYVKNLHGISRKYLQRYIAAFWAKVGVDRWSKGSFLKSCMKLRRLSYGEILDYNSPKKLRTPWTD